MNTHQGVHARIEIALTILGVQQAPFTGKGALVYKGQLHFATLITQPAHGLMVVQTSQSKSPENLWDKTVTI